MSSPLWRVRTVLAAALVLADAACRAGPGTRRAGEPATCETRLSDQPTPGVDNRVQARLPVGIRLVDEGPDLYQKAELLQIQQSRCHAHVVFGWFNLVVDVPETHEDLRDRAINLALRVPEHEVHWSSVTIRGREFDGAYTYADYYPGVSPRRGWAALVMDEERAYYVVLDTDDVHWQALSLLFRDSARTLMLSTL